MNDRASSAPGVALARIPGRAEARVLQRLADGPTNRSYLVQDGRERLVLRLDKPEALALGLDRVSERAVCAVVAAAGLSPAYEYFDVAAGVALRAWIDGRSLAPADLGQPAVLSALAAVLRKLHALPPAGRRFEPLKDAGRYARQLGTAAAAALLRQAEVSLADAPLDDEHQALCHNDLVSANLVETAAGELVPIDWEYAGLGDPYFDLAVVVRHHGLGEGLAAHLLEAYLGREPSESERRRLARQCDFYGCLLALWNLRIKRT